MLVDIPLFWVNTIETLQEGDTIKCITDENGHLVVNVYNSAGCDIAHYDTVDKEEW